MSQISNTLSFEIGTNNVPIGEGIYGLVNFTQYGEIDKKLDARNPFKPANQVN